MRLIDADALIKDNGLESATKYGNRSAEQRNRSYSTMMLYEIAEMIDEAPTIDAEPIVRCKNCEFVDTLECPMNYIDHQRLIFSNRSPDWFCAEGVKK